MNKNMKRVVSGLAALGIALSGMALGVSSAYADDDYTATGTLAKAKDNNSNSGTITIKNQANDSVEHALNAYRLGWMYEVTSNDDGSLKSFQIDTNDDYVAAIEAALKDVKSTSDTDKTLYQLYESSSYHKVATPATGPQDEANPLGWISEYFSGSDKDGKQLIDWSKKDTSELRLLATALKNELTKVDTSYAPTYSGQKALKSSVAGYKNTVAEGYYLLLDTLDGDVTDAAVYRSTQSIPILVASTIPASVTTAGTADVTKDLGEVTLKASVPSIAKQVVRKNADDTFVADTKPDYNIGDVIYYELTTTIPNYTSYTKCDTSVDSVDATKCRQLKVIDTAEEGLYIQNVVSVKVGNDSLTDTEYETDLNNYTHYEGNEEDNNATQNIIDLRKYVNSDKVAEHYGDTVTIIVKANLNEEAKISTPGKPQPIRNKVSLTYSNKFDKVQEAKTINGGEVNVYTFTFQLKKTAMDGTTPVNGAKFKVQKDGGQWLKPVYDDGNNITAWKEVDEKQAQEFTSNGGGMISGLYGLEAGTYTVKETAPAKGYTTFALPSFKVTITPTWEPDDATRPTGIGAENWGDYKLTDEDISLSGNDTRVAKATDGTDKDYTIHVKNAKNLSQLPMTGGAGLVAVIAVGVLLAGAGTAAAVRSRKSTSRAVRI